jgi:hypothetical protein
VKPKPGAAPAAPAFFYIFSVFSKKSQWASALARAHCLPILPPRRRRTIMTQTKKMRTYVKTSIESVVTSHFSQRGVRDRVRNANGFVGHGFVGVPMADKERTKLLDGLFGRGRWPVIEEEENN